MANKPQKKGRLAQDEEGNTVLVNEDEESFEADEIVIAIWNSFDGSLTVEQMAHEISEESGEDKEDVTEAICNIINNLEKADLIEQP